MTDDAPKRTEAEKIPEWGLVEHGPTRMHLLVPDNGDVRRIEFMAVERRWVEKLRAEGANFSLWRLHEHWHEGKGAIYLLVASRDFECAYPVHTLYVRFSEDDRPWMHVKALNKGNYDFRGKRLTAEQAVRWYCERLDYQVSLSQKGELNLDHINRHGTPYCTICGQITDSDGDHVCTGLRYCRVECKFSYECSQGRKPPFCTVNRYPLRLH